MVEAEGVEVELKMGVGGEVVVEEEKQPRV